MGRGPERIFFQRRHTDGQQTHEKMLNITSHQGNANQKHNEITTSHVSEWVLSKRQEKDVEKRELLCTVGRNVNWCSYYGKQYRDASNN